MADDKKEIDKDKFTWKKGDIRILKVPNRPKTGPGNVGKAKDK